MNPDMTLAAAVVENPNVRPVFDALGLDYCCGGQQRVGLAVAQAGLSMADVEAAVAEASVRPAPQTYENLEAPELIDYVIETHHRYLQSELPPLVELANKVWTVHGENHPELRRVAQLTRALHDDLIPHMAKEERVLFPSILRVVGADEPVQLPFGSLQNPITMMNAEHELTGELLADIRNVAKLFAPPADACGSYTALYERLDRVTADTHLHVHIENNVLFPMAVAAEAAAAHVAG